MRGWAYHPIHNSYHLAKKRSLFEQTNLAAAAEQMGAIHKYDLTSDVTHLIVGDTDTPKYKFVAKERLDVKCLLPSWIEAVRQSWLEAGTIDVLALEEQHRLPALYGLKICVTGFVDGKQILKEANPLDVDWCYSR